MQPRVKNPSSFGQILDNSTLYLNIYVSPDNYLEEKAVEEASINALGTALLVSKSPDFYTNEETRQKAYELIRQYILSSTKPIEISKSSSNLIKDTLIFLGKNNPFKARSVLAQTCSGTFECGNNATQLKCTVGGGICSYVGEPCGGTGACYSAPICQEKIGGGAILCGNYFDCGPHCAPSECIVDGSNSCSLGGGGGPTPTPGGTISCGTQTCNASTEVCCATGCKSIAEGCAPQSTSMTMQVVVGLDKNRNGIFDDGYYQVIEDPVDTNCGTFPNISGLTVGYSGAATGTIGYHTNCAGGAYNYPYSTKGIPATGNFTFTLNNLPSNYSLKWIEESTGKCKFSGGVVTCTGLANGQTYGLWFFIQESGVANCKNLTGPATLYVGETGTFTAASVAS